MYHKSQCVIANMLSYTDNFILEYLITKTQKTSLHKSQCFRFFMIICNFTNYVNYSFINFLQLKAGKETILKFYKLISVPSYHVGVKHNQWKGQSQNYKRTKYIFKTWTGIQENRQEGNIDILGEFKIFDLNNRIKENSSE